MELLLFLLSLKKRRSKKELRIVDMQLSLFIALSSGFIGALFNVMVLWGIRVTQGTFIFDKNFIYKQVFWGGAWALLFCLPILKGKWVQRSIIVSIIASCFTFFVFKTIPITLLNVFIAFIVNVLVWGMISSYLYHHTLKKIH